MLTKGERQQIKALLQDPKWQTIEHLVDEFCDKIKYESIVREDEWNTLKTAVLNEGRIQGIRNFIQELYKQAQNEQ